MQRIGSTKEDNGTRINTRYDEEIGTRIKKRENKFKK